MKIKWYGHATFEITTNSGAVILHDPYKDMLGYKLPPGLSPDLVLSSHNHDDHNYTQSLKPGFEFVNQLGTIETKVTTVEGITSFHDHSQGAERGVNTIYSYTVDGLKVCHLGDLGHKLEPQQVVELKNIDVLFLPVGGGYTIDSQVGLEVVNQLQPQLVIPMHYRTAAMGPFGLKFKKVTDFTKLINCEVLTLGSTILDFERTPIETLPPVVVMEYK